MGITQLEAGLEGDGGLSGCNYSCKGISNELLLDALERGAKRAGSGGPGVNPSIARACVSRPDNEA